MIPDDHLFLPVLHLKESGTAFYLRTYAERRGIRLQSEIGVILKPVPHRYRDAAIAFIKDIEPSHLHVLRPFGIKPVQGIMFRIAGYMMRGIRRMVPR